MNIAQHFKIGPFPFSLCVDETLPLPDHFRHFSAPPWEGAYQYRLSLADSLPRPEGMPLYQREDLCVYPTETNAGGWETRLIGAKGANRPYALYRECNASHAEILFCKDQLSYLTVDPAFVSLFALERRMLALDALVLHCAYLNHNNQALLFSAPSGTGKTTQAQLWEAHRGARQINGDRCLLSPSATGWQAGGWPVCGSSHICHNTTLPLRAIIMVKQAPENRVRQLRGSQAFLQLYPQITVNSWNRDAILRTSKLLEQLISHVPVYELSCTISEDAVACLESALNNAPFPVL